MCASMYVASYSDVTESSVADKSCVLLYIHTYSLVSAFNLIFWRRYRDFVDGSA